MKTKNSNRPYLLRYAQQGKRLKEKATGIPGCNVAASGPDAANLNRLQAEIVALLEALNKSAA